VCAILLLLFVFLPFPFLVTSLALQLDGLEIKKTGITRIANRGNSRTAPIPLNIRDELVLFEELGRGASGVVRKALHVPTLQLVAVKVRTGITCVCVWVRVVHAMALTRTGARCSAREDFRPSQAPPNGVRAESSVSQYGAARCQEEAL